jgi:hypothetical protein
MSSIEPDLWDDITGTLDELERVLRDCLDLAEIPAAKLRMARTLVDGLLAAEYGRVAALDGRGRDWPFPEGAGDALNVEGFLVRSAERFLADISTMVILLRPPDPEVGRRHGVDPSDDSGARCLCGWRSPNPAPDRAPIAQHYLAVIELGKDLDGHR